MVTMEEVTTMIVIKFMESDDFHSTEAQEELIGKI